MQHRIFADSLPLHREEGAVSGGSDYCIFGVPFDGTSSFRTGSGNGPWAIREASYNFESYLPASGIDLADLPIFDAGDVDEAGTVETLMESIKMELQLIFSDHPNLFPIFIGGEHSLTPPAVEFLDRMMKKNRMETVKNSVDELKNGMVTKNNRMATDKAKKKNGEKLGIIVLDAHMDMRDEYLGIPNSHACAVRRCSEIVGTPNIIPIGVRSYSMEEAEFFEPLRKEDEFSFFSNIDVKRRGAGDVAREALERLKSNGCTKIYLSIDMDVFDPSEAPGVGNPEPGGLGYFDVMGIVEVVAPYLCGMDVVEMNPLYDKGITALLGAKILRETIGFHYRAGMK